MDNYILTYYQQIKDGTAQANKWVTLAYEYLVKGLEDGLFKFDAKKADFSPNLKEKTALISQAEQTTRITMDEEGIKAASYVDYLVGAPPPPKEEIDFTLDRPFFFMITGFDEVPYFAGVMNDP